MQEEAPTTITTTTTTTTSSSKSGRSSKKGVEELMSVRRSQVSESSCCSFEGEEEDDDEEDDENKLTSQGLINGNNYHDHDHDHDHHLLLRHFQEESENFMCVKVLLVALFMAVTVGVSMSLYMITKNQQMENFTRQFLILAETIQTQSVTNQKQTLGHLEMKSHDITSDSLNDTASQWPLYTIPHFDQAVGQSLVEASPHYNMEIVGYAPTVTDSSKKAWQEYSQGDIIPSVGKKNYLYSPVWQFFVDTNANTTTTITTNFDMRSIENFERAVTTLEKTGHSVISQPMNVTTTPMNGNGNDDEEPYYFFLIPIWDHLEEVQQEQKPAKQPRRQVVATLFTQQLLHTLFADDMDKNDGSNHHPNLATASDEEGEEEEGLGPMVVLRDTCTSTNSGGLQSNHDYSYSLYEDGSPRRYLGNKDLHASVYDSLVVSTPLTTTTTTTMDGNADDNLETTCIYILDIYPTLEYENSFSTKEPWIMAGIVIGVFLVTGLALLYYNRTVQKHENIMLHKAMTTTNMLASLFPTNVHDRLFKRQGGGVNGDNNKNGYGGGDDDFTFDLVHRVQDISNNISTSRRDDDYLIEGMYSTKPIADLFLKTTIMFADIVGFTAWSSERDPIQIFTLLETIFRSWDKLASKSGIFKVETIGDCYVAVAGLPYAREDHAVVMASYAKKCLAKMTSIVKYLELSLGPDTGNLSARVGLHSGPVTAGVLRGEKSRFQLFGDSVNTAARMLTTGTEGKIHISHETAELLLLDGHSKMIVPRKDLVTAKGKGVMRTYWLFHTIEHENPIVKNLSLDGLTMSCREDAGVVHKPGSLLTINNKIDEEGDEEEDGTGQQDSSNGLWGAGGVTFDSYARLVEWNVDILYQLLETVIVQRKKKLQTKTVSTPSAPAMTLDLRFSMETIDSGVNELKKQEDQAKDVIIDPIVKDQLRDYVRLIARMYREHPFHNFDHASHVMLSIMKLMTRINTANLEGTGTSFSYGIVSDPLLQFSVAFSALIHDVDHAGIPNTQLVKEDAIMAKKYRFRSVAEKHSVRLAWERFMDSEYREFRNALCPNQNDLKRFRNFVVNVVMATDIADKDLNTKRKERWRKCFDEWPESPTKDDLQRKATVVVEHLIQASDVAHTMQHFEIFLKWNERLFYEVYGAYESGRGGDNDPSLNWYNGEIGFFDFYIIPLAKKLGACGVFGVSSDEYLNYAEENRQRWKEAGESHVELWVQRYRAKYGKYCQQDQKTS